MCKIPVFMASDENFAPFVAITMASILKNTSSFVEFYVLDSGISKKNKQKIINLNKFFKNFSIEFIEVDTDKYFKNLPEMEYISKSMYSRLLIPVLKPKLEKVIYTDVDVVFIKDIKELYETDLDDFVVGAVSSYRFKECEKEYLEAKHRLKISANHKQFMSGLLLINCKKWNSLNHTDRLLKLASELSDNNLLKLCDQDVLNKYFDNNYMPLDKKYSIIPKCLELNFDNNEVETLLNDAVVLHFTGGELSKPWNNKNQKSAQDWWKYVKYTEFKKDINKIYNNYNKGRFIKSVFSIKNIRNKLKKIKQICICDDKFKIRFKNKKIITNNNQKFSDLRIAFIVSGGFGDFLINANFIYCFKNFVMKNTNSNVFVDVYARHHQKKSFEAAFNENTFIDKMFILEDNPIPKDSYDLIITLHSHLNFNYYNLEKIQMYCSELHNFIKVCEKFKENTDFFATYHANHYHIALANNQNRLQLADVDKTIGVKKEFEYPVPYPNNENAILEKFNLENKTFITFNRGIDKNSTNIESTKMWAFENYQELVSKIKSNYKDIVLVQIGASPERCKIIDGVDINLVGKTTLEDIKVLIKNSFLHIDCEGGLAHLRNALHAKHPAIVIFGPTNPDLYGYSSNINLYKKDACPIYCDWIVQNWQKKCLRGFKNPPCTNSITVDEVFEVVKNYVLKNSEG